MKRLLLIIVPAAVWGGWASASARAIPQFQKEFLMLYVDENENEAFVDAVKQAKCLLCHVGKKKKNHNSYGTALSELLDRKKDKADKKKIRAALAKVATLPLDPDDKESPTYGQLIEEGKLPGGDPQEKDPPDEEK